MESDMQLSQKYLRDKTILFLISVSIFLTFLSIILLLLRSGLGGQGANSYIISYRANLGLSAYQRGSIIQIFSFALFALVILAINILLSIRTYTIRRTLALTILGLGILLLILGLIVSNALLTLI